MSIEAIVANGRRLIGTSFLDRARIQDRTMVRDTSGGQKETFTERGVTIECRFVTPKDDDPILKVDSVFGPATMVLLMPLGTVFEEGDRVRNLIDSSVFQITRDVSVPSELAVLMRAGIREV
jgi:hypothetical protein